MGASAREIEQQIKETRARMDSNLTRLESQAQSSAVRYGRIAAMLLGAVLLGGIAFVVYRRTRPRSLRDRLEGLSWGQLRDLRDRLPSVTVRLNERTAEEPGTVESILRSVAPALVGTAGSALLSRIAAMPEEDDRRAPRP